jgi:hypothetical protein
LAAIAAFFRRRARWIGVSSGGASDMARSALCYGLRQDTPPAL